MGIFAKHQKRIFSYGINYGSKLSIKNGEILFNFCGGSRLIAENLHVYFVILLHVHSAYANRRRIYKYEVALFCLVMFTSNHALANISTGRRLVFSILRKSEVVI